VTRNIELHVNIECVLISIELSWQSSSGLEYIETEYRYIEIIIFLLTFIFISPDV